MNPSLDPSQSSVPESPNAGYADQPALNLQSAAEQSIAGLIRLARKYFWLVAICVAIGLAAAAIKNHTSAKIYTATANIEITQDTANQFRLGASAGGDTFIDSSKIDTEMTILQSSTLAMQTIESLHLDKDKDFAPLPPGQSWDLSRTPDRHALIAVFQAGVSAARLGHTNIVTLSVRSTNPELAAKICNTLISNYTEHNFKDNYTATEQVSSWLGAQLGALKHRLEASQEHMLAMQKEIGLVGIDQTQSTTLARLETLNRNLTQVETDRLVQEGKLVALRSSSPAVTDALAADPVLAQLRLKRVQTNEEYSTLLSKYGPANPRIVTLRAELDQIDKSIAEAEAVAIHKAEKEVEAIGRNESALQSALDAEKQKAYDSNSKVVEYSLAKREYEANRTLYESLQQRLEEAGIIAGLHSSSIRLIDPADAPDFPSFPRTRFNLGVGFLAGLAVGILIVFLLEAMDTNIRTISDVEQLLGLPMLGVIPQVDPKELSPEIFTRQATSAGQGRWSQVAEAYRALRTSILLSRPGSPPQVVLITSSKPAEGKTSVAVLEALTLAMSGVRVLLVDADLRRPSAHVRFKVGNSVGLSSVLTGKSTFEAALHKPAFAPSMHLLPAGPVAPLPAELLGSSQMRDLLVSLKSQYDFIVIDTPPILTVTDAAVLSTLADGVVLVLRYGETSKNVVRRTGETLFRSGAHLLGAVVNAVNFKSPDYAEYYGRSYRDYYEYQAPEDLEA